MRVEDLLQKGGSKKDVMKNTQWYKVFQDRGLSEFSMWNQVRVN